MEIKEEIIIENIKREKDIKNSNYYDQKICNYYQKLEDFKDKLFSSNTN